MKKETPFELGSFPYSYECESCHHPETKMEHDLMSELFLKDTFDVETNLPLFFQCVHCKTGLIKPIGYTGKPSYVVECESDEDFVS